MPSGCSRESTGVPSRDTIQGRKNLWPGYIWAVASKYIWALAQDNIPRLDNVTDNHCHSRLRSQIFPVSRSGIILTVYFVQKRTLFGLFERLRAPKKLIGPFSSQNKPMKNDTTSSHWPKSARSSLNVSDIVEARIPS